MAEEIDPNLPENTPNKPEGKQSETNPSKKAESAPEDSSNVEEVADIGEKLRSLLSSILLFFKGTLSFWEDVDHEGTVQGVKRDIDFKGYNVWILVFSIFIASVGLNTNSPAVVIGAMLISPLMGPIVGVGLSIGTNDWKTLLRSLKSFGVMIFISILTSTLYFLISPLGDASLELLARTKPTLLDVLVAVFGGLAGIMAGSRKEKTNVIPGVAIATALMPPLCTAGYGLATFNFPFFFGAFYLFLLNSVFISLSTLVVVRYLRFPLVQFVDPVREKKIKRYIILIAVLVIVPSAWLLFGVVRESIFKNNAQQYIAEVIQYEGCTIINEKVAYDPKTPTIEISLIGEIVPRKMLNEWEASKVRYGLEKTVVSFNQAKDVTEKIKGEMGQLGKTLSSELKAGVLEEIYIKNSAKLEEREQYIAKLENKLIKAKKDSLPIDDMMAELRIQYPEIEKISFGKSIEANPELGKDTLPFMMVKWDAKLKSKKKLELENRLTDFMVVRWKLDTLVVVPFPE